MNEASTKAGFLYVGAAASTVIPGPEDIVAAAALAKTGKLLSNFRSALNRLFGKNSDKYADRRAPGSLQDEMALDAAREGQGDVIIESLADPKFEGMQKVELKVKSNDGKDSVVHYVRDPETLKQYDYKFQKRSEE